MKGFCKKKKYITRDFAENLAKPENNIHGVQLRAYKCPKCHYYHLTKKL